MLFSFDGGSGAIPNGLVQDLAGNFYGTTQSGGTRGAGVVYKLDATGKETVLYSFTNGADGGLPYAGLIRDSAGNLYGTTRSGGIATSGVVFKVDMTGKETVLYSFFTHPGDGAYPQAGLIRDSAGNLYGTTSQGGITTGACAILSPPYGCGVVYKLDTTGKETVLYSFTNGADGGLPQSGLIRDSVGNLYGTTQIGGIASGYSGYGVAFKLDTVGKETVLHAFSPGERSERLLGLDGRRSWPSLGRYSVSQ